MAAEQILMIAAGITLILVAGIILMIAAGIMIMMAAAQNVPCGGFRGTELKLQLPCGKSNIKHNRMKHKYNTNITNHKICTS